MQKLLLILLFPTVLVACSGGGDGGGGGGSAPMAPVATTVSGMVTAPGGAIAFNKEISFQDFFSTDAYAALNGLVAVPDGTIVELAQLSLRRGDVGLGMVQGIRDRSVLAHEADQPL